MSICARRRRAGNNLQSAAKYDRIMGHENNTSFAVSVSNVSCMQGENSMKKRTFYTEAAYVLGIVILAIGTAMMERADFGMSMVVAPAYLLHLKISQRFAFFSFGMAEYVLQAALILALMAIQRRAKRAYLFSFCTAVIYGFALDAAIALAALIPGAGMAARIAYYFAGMVLCSAGVACLFETYISPEAYELFVKEMAERTGRPISKVKTVYDCASCAAAVLMSFAFFGFGHFEGVKAGTIVCALVNGWLIGRISAMLKARFAFRDGLKMRRYFE